MPVPTANRPSQETLDTCRTLQQEEFEVLESIYPEFISSQLTEATLKLEIPIEFEAPRDVAIIRHGPLSNAPTEATDSSSMAPVAQSLSVSTLPPLLIHISLPPSYPLYEPPRLLSIRATHFWLPRVGLLNKILTDMWQAGDGILYGWIEYLRTGEFLEALGLAHDDTSVIEISHPNPPILAPLLAGYDVSSKSSQFAKLSYPCSICLTSLKGSKCLKLSCSHIFCRPCLQDFWGLCIEEGDVSRVGCPDPACVKEKREANEEEVARVVSDEEVTRWRWLREKRDLDRDPTIVHCPVDVCQAAVTQPANEDPESGWARFRQCPNCTFSFCAFCRRTWHGPVTPCAMPHSEKLVLEYMAEEAGSEKFKIMELRYGKNNLTRLVNRYKEEMANREWLDRSTTQCPGCSCNVEKNLGCNHITCWRCGKHFCYRCGAAISGKDPYAHFSQPGSCYGKLFDYRDGEDDDWQIMV